MKTNSPLNKKKAIPKKETLPPSNFSEQEELQPIFNGLEKPKDALENPFTVVAIGASSGGLEAITLLIQNLSPNTGMAYIVVVHLSPDNKSMLTSLLSKVTDMTVQDIHDMEKMRPNNIYVIPHNKDIEVTYGYIKLIPRSKGGAAISIDVLFSSLAETHKENVIGIVLSGNANDGTRGLKEIKEAGGITFAQDDSAKFTSMPHSAIAEGVVDFILSPKDIATELAWISKHPLVNRDAIKPAPEDEMENNNPDLQLILGLLYKRNNVNFSNYKMNTIKRRLLRRMILHKIKTIDHYAELLVKDTNEVDLLYQDLLISVTEFFRDSEAFSVLKKSILPRLLKTKAEGETLRIWVAACATGEEVYSIAMILHEIQQNKTNKIPFQIFASDLSPDAIAFARMGEYSFNQLKNISPKQRQLFFTKTKDKYQILKSLRDVCVFAHHNILNDPPFSLMDFISCRNFLIYLDTFAQKKAISTFHYALNEGGYLMLGKSETIGSSAQLFSVKNKKLKFFSRKKNSSTQRNPDIITRITKVNLPIITNTITPKKTLISANGNLGNAFDKVLLSQYVPASVIINYDLEILQFKGQTAPFLQNSSGKASFNVLKMAHLDIVFELRNAIHNAIKTKQAVRKMGIEMSRDIEKNIAQLVNIEVAPIKVEGEEPLLIIVFMGQQIDLPEYPQFDAKNNSIAKDRRIKKLEEELMSARADMRSITNDQEAAYEELQSASEEIISSNEELQSLNEELETSKEEIEATNEELITSNQELHIRIQQIEELYTYYEGIISTVHEPVLILDKNIRIKSANKSFCKVFHVIEDEIIGISLYKLGNSQWNLPRLRELLEEIVPKNSRFHDFEVEQTFPIIGQKTLLLNAHRIVQESKHEEFIVLTIADITEVKRLAIELEVRQKRELELLLENKKQTIKAIEDSNIRYNLLLMQSPFAYAIMQGEDLIITFANNRLIEIWGKGKQIVGRPLLEILPELKDSINSTLIKNVYKTGVNHRECEVLVSLLRNGKMENAYFSYVYQPYYDTDATISGVVVIAEEVTSHVIIKKELIEAKNNAEIKTKIALDAVKAKQQFLSNMSHEIRTPMNAIIGFTNVILKTDLDNSQKEYLNAIKISGDALVILINDILDLAKVDSGKMTFEQMPFNLSIKIDTVFQMFEAKAKEKNIKLIKIFDENIPTILIGDSMRLRQIMLNLLGNAIKFTQKGEIIMATQLLNEDEEKVTIEFKLTDTGIGIPDNKLENIFNNFEQAHKETSSSYGGTGLGLAIVKQLVEGQGGTVMVKSKLGKGSTFVFILDFFKSQSNESIVDVQNLFQPMPKLNSEMKKIKILVAEDVVLNQLLIKIILTVFDFEVDIAENGKIAIEKLSLASLGSTELTNQSQTSLTNKEAVDEPSLSYDIILMDIQMPGMNGFETTSYIRNEMKSQIPIIALTADVTTVDIDKCLAHGMNDYISKPIDEKLLYSKIMKCLKKTE